MKAGGLRVELVSCEWAEQHNPNLWFVCALGRGGPAVEDDGTASNGLFVWSAILLVQDRTGRWVLDDERCC